MARLNLLLHKLPTRITVKCNLLNQAGKSTSDWMKSKKQAGGYKGATNFKYSWQILIIDWRGFLCVCFMFNFKVG